MKSTCYLCDKQVETEELEIGQYPICDECVKRMENEDKLDPAQKEHNFPKYNLDADFWRNRWVESSAEVLQQELKFIKLEKKLATAVGALKKSRERLGDFQEPWNDREKELDLILSEALAEIGGKDGR